MIDEDEDGNLVRVPGAVIPNEPPAIDFNELGRAFAVMHDTVDAIIANEPRAKPAAKPAPAAVYVPKLQKPVNNIPGHQVPREPAHEPEPEPELPLPDVLLPFKDRILEPAKYTIVYKLFYNWEKVLKDGVSHVYPVDALNQYTILLHAPTSLADILDLAIEDYKYNNSLNLYEFDVTAITDVDIVLYSQRDLAEKKLKGDPIHYEFLRKTKGIHKQPGRCVFDAIIASVEADRASGKRTIPLPTVEELVKYFGKHSLQEGVSTNQIMLWAQKQRYVSCYAIDPFLQTFKYVVADGGTTQHTFVFIVNNGHCYAILDQEYKQQIINKGRIDMVDSKFDVERFDEHSIVRKADIEATMDQLVQGTVDMAADAEPKWAGFPHYNEDAPEALLRPVGLGPGQKGVVLIETDNLLQLTVDVSHTTSYHVCSMRFVHSKVTCFEHPVSKQIYMTAEDYDERVDACAKLYAIHPSTDFTFKNQTFAQLANSYFKIHYGTIAQSERSPALSTILDEQATMKPRVLQFKTTRSIADIEGLDIARAYSSAVIENTHDYPVFSPFDDICPLNINTILTVGEYIIDCDFTTCGGHVKYSKGRYPLPLVEHAIAKKYIMRSNVTHQYKALRHLAHDTFKPVVEDFNNIFGSRVSVSKTLSNCLIGSLNQRYVTSVKGCLTMDYDCAMGVVLNETTLGRTPTVQHVSDHYVIHSEYRKEKPFTNMPIYDHILAVAAIKLDKLYEDVCGGNPEAELVSITVDAIKVYRPNRIAFKDPKELLPGDYRPEVVTCIKGKFPEEFESNPPFTYVRPIWTTCHEYYKPEQVDEFGKGNFKDIVRLAYSKPCLVNGKAGSGKSEVLKRIARPDLYPCTFPAGTKVPKCRVLVATNRARDNLIQRGVEDVHTIQSYLSEKLSLDDQVKKIKGLDMVCFDEMSMIGTEMYALFGRIKKALGDSCPQFKFFGDTSQCASMDDVKYNYTANSFIKSLCGKLVITLIYKEGISRSDKALYDMTLEFLKTGYLPPHNPARDIVKSYTNITATNDTMKDTNAACLRDYIAEPANALKERLDIGGSLWLVGMPLIAIENVYTVPERASAKIFNAQGFTLNSFTADSVVLAPLANAHDQTHIKVPFKYFTSSIAPGFAITVQRSQGGSIDTHYNIHELDKQFMSQNSLYTALSRATKLEFVHYKHTDKHFKPARYSYKSILTHLTPNEVLDGLIYEITDTNQSFFYVGETTTTIEERLEQHKQKPVNDKMRIALNKPGVRISVIDRIQTCDRALLLNLETHWIQKYAKDITKQHKLLNVKGAKKAPPKVVVKIVQPPLQAKKRFQVVSYPAGKYLLVRGTIPKDGDTPAWRKQCKFRYVPDDDPEAATRSLAIQMVNAKALSLELNRKYTKNFAE
jgi:hypothetical protein